MKKVSKTVKRRLFIFGTLSMIAIVYFFGTIISYTYTYTSLRKEETSLKRNLASLQQEKVDLRTEIEKLNDPEYIARFAKERFLYSASDEYVIKIDDTREVEDEIIETDNKVLYAVLGGSVAFMFVFVIIIKSKK